jgi:hypothetical protein
MFLPLCLELPRIRSGDRYTVFEILTNADDLVAVDAYDRYEMDMILGQLEERGFEPFTPGHEIKTLARFMHWRLGGMDIFSREYPILERLDALKEACEIHRWHGTSRVLTVVNQLFTLYSTIPDSNAPVLYGYPGDQ